jgi:hypothetical protein
MENEPRTRKELKGGKKGPRDTIYSNRRVREMEALMEKKGLASKPAEKDPKKK